MLFNIPFDVIIQQLCLIFDEALTLKQVVDTVQLYLSRPIAVSFTMEFASSLNFPAVTVCNVNPMRYVQAQHGLHKVY